MITRTVENFVTICKDKVLLTYSVITFVMWHLTSSLAAKKTWKQATAQIKKNCTRAVTIKKLSVRELTKDTHYLNESWVKKKMNSQSSKTISYNMKKTDWMQSVHQLYNNLLKAWQQHCFYFTQRYWVSISD
jgi:hypothetical protein